MSVIHQKQLNEFYVQWLTNVFLMMISGDLTDEQMEWNGMED
jgi:hypothetical protein